MEPRDQQLMVALRIRPLSAAELEQGATVTTHKVGDQMVVLMDPSEDPEDTLRTHRSRERTFTFDAVFDQRASQGDVYRATAQHLVAGVLSGYNATVFAYGPSGAGKTHTMLGVDAEPGIYLRTLTDLFQAIEGTRDDMDYSVSMSYLEVYNEVLRDLLNPSSGVLDLREDARGAVQIAGITEVSTSNAQEIMQLLTRGNRQRTQEPTATNQTSSRSHAVLQVTVRQQSRGPDVAGEVCVGRLFMVDLAGSERASQTQNRGKRLQEGAHINRSLLALGNCIAALSEKGSGRTQFVNFRDSKLTRLLKDALGGNSRTVMIAHISPASTHFEESRSTLLFAHRARSIKTRVKRNLLNVSCHLDQYTGVISDLRRQIEHLKSKMERRQDPGKRSEPGARDAQVSTPTQDTEDNSRLQMNRIRAQLVGAFEEQLEMRRSLLELENTSVGLHIAVSRHLLAVADWEREKTHHHAQDESPERDEQQEAEVADADRDGDEDVSAEPHEVTLAREEVNMLLAEQRKTVALKAGLEQRLASAQSKAAQLERLLPARALSEDQQEALRLLCRAQELELENAGLQAGLLRRDSLLCQKDLVIRRCHQHRLLCERIIQDQRQLLQDGGLPVPAALAEYYSLYSREQGEGSLDRLLKLHSVMASSLQDGPVGNTSPLPEESSRDQPDDWRDLPCVAQFEPPPVLLDTDSMVRQRAPPLSHAHPAPGQRLFIACSDGHRSSKATPSKQLGKQSILVPPPALHILLTPPSREKSGSPSMRSRVSKLCSPAGPELDTPRTAAATLKEMALSTKSIALIAATRRSQAQDRKRGSSHSSLHLPEEVALDSRDPSPADRRWPRASTGRGGSAERKASRKQSPLLTWGAQPAAERPQPPPLERSAERQTPPAPRRLPSGRGFFPAVPAASKMKPDLSLHAGSADSGSQCLSPRPPSSPRKRQGGSARGPRRPK
ncbi:kinesin-like protein KIF19 isoform X5 [Desmodus rotundus]|uniref:kinesin-like protein KIF19 isoform X5 n=1 Tax=Desmodus rotundus TaxID=9430 RepID=UPI00238137BA|nr:kinesin-like protein KIF19 isoform X2 [Desmodus rotundus]